MLAARCGHPTQPDPIGLAGGLNLYGFAGGDPINFSDPFGLSKCPPACGEVFEQLRDLAPAMEQELATFVPKNAAMALGGRGAAAVLGRVASRIFGARAVSQVVAGSGGHISRAVSGSNAAGLSQSQAIEAITRVTESTGRGVGAVVDGAAGARIMTGTVSGTGQPIVQVSANGAARMGFADVRHALGEGGNLVTTVSNIVFK